MATIGLRKYYANGTAFFADLQLALAAMGWTLHDNIDSTHKVYKTNGEDADKPYIYLWIYLSGNTTYFRLWLYWNATTHAGSAGAYYQSGYMNVDVSAKYATISGNKNIICAGCDSYMAAAGYCNKMFYPVPTTTTDAISAGSDVSIPVVSSTGFKKGDKCQIVGVNYEGRDQLAVTAIPDSTHVTVASVPRGYASGAFLGITPCPAFITGRGSTRTDVSLLCPHDAIGTADTANVDQRMSRVTLFATQLDPDEAVGRHILQPWIVQQVFDSLVGYVDEVTLCSPLSTPVANDVFGVCAEGTPEQGTASTGDSTTLSDSTKSWATDEWAGKYLVLVDGTGLGHARKIASNTSNTLTVETAWDIAPDATTTYRIVDSLYRAHGWGFLFLESQHAIS